MLCSVLSWTSELQSFVKPVNILVEKVGFSGLAALYSTTAVPHLSPFYC